MTPEEQRRGDGLDERLAREEPDRRTQGATEAAAQLVDDGPQDDEGELVADAASGEQDVDDEDELLETLGSGGDDDVPMEEAAVHVLQDAAPGATDDASDGYVTQEREEP
jgi:hypothetical protein